MYNNLLVKFKTLPQNTNENENKENNQIENNSPNNITLKDNIFNEKNVSYNQAIKKLVCGKNKTPIDKDTNKDKPNIGKSEEDLPEDLNNKRLSEIERLFKLDFQSKFTSLKTGRNDFIIKERSDEQLNKCSLFIEDIMIAKVMCDNNSENLAKEIKFTNEEAQKRANLYFRMKVKYDFVMEKVLSFINSMVEISDTEKENDSNKNLIVESENVMERVVSFENSMSEVSGNEEENDSSKIFMTETEIKLESETKAEEVKEIKICNKKMRLSKSNRDNPHVKPKQSHNIRQMYRRKNKYANKCHKCGLILKTRANLTRHIEIVHKKKRRSEAYEEAKLVYIINETEEISFESSDEKETIETEGNMNINPSINNTEVRNKELMVNFDKENLILTKSDEDKERFQSIVHSMLSQISQDEGYKCLVCHEEFVGRQGNGKNNAKSHVDHNHTHNILHKCHICGLIVKTSDKLTRHIGKVHKNILNPINKKLKGTKFERKKMASTSISRSNSSKKQIKLDIMNTDSEGEKIKKEKLSLPSNENENISELEIPPQVLANNKENRYRTSLSKSGTHLNIDSVQTPIALKFNIPIPNRETPQLVEKLLETSEIVTDAHKEASKNIRRENNTKYDNLKKNILTNSDEDKAKFQLIVEGMIKKNSLGESYKCLMCNREFDGPHAKRHAKSHVDYKHTENILHKCHICDLILKNRDGLTRHIGKLHKKSK